MGRALLEVAEESAVCTGHQPVGVDARQSVIGLDELDVLDRLRCKRIQVREEVVQALEGVAPNADVEGEGVLLVKTSVASSRMRRQVRRRARMFSGRRLEQKWMSS
jgi:hypothetical protein